MSRRNDWVQGTISQKQLGASACVGDCVIVERVRSRRDLIKVEDELEHTGDGDWGAGLDEDVAGDLVPYLRQHQEARQAYQAAPPGAPALRCHTPLSPAGERRRWRLKR